MKDDEREIKTGTLVSLNLSFTGKQTIDIELVRQTSIEERDSFLIALSMLNYAAKHYEKVLEDVKARVTLKDDEVKKPH